MRKFITFITAVCILFLIKLRLAQEQKSLCGLRLVKTSLTQNTKPINDVNVNQNIYSKKMNNERPTNGTSWYSFMTNTGFEAF